MTRHIDVFISSTSLDLPIHREQVMNACIRQGMFPIMMEHLPANDSDAIDASLSMVEQANIYIGIFAFRYGYVPNNPRNPDKCSITELEYRHAVKMEIPRLIFIMSESHQITGADVETGRSAINLKRFKKQLMTENIVAFFDSPNDLRAHVIDSLARYRQVEHTLHYVSNIPPPPKPYIAHPYTLLQSSDLIGRKEELGLLTDWITKVDSAIYQKRVLCVTAIGGMGKSALTWRWFNDVVTYEVENLAGRVWWSFYESDAHFDNFIIRTLSYISNRSREYIEKNTKPAEREEALISILDKKPFLLILDGMERILVAYSRMDAAHLRDAEIDNTYHLRETTDPRAGDFLVRLTRLKNSRVLISTRLYPSALQDKHSGELLPGCYQIRLSGLQNEDAVDLWRSFNVRGKRDILIPLFNTFGNHPLVLKALAGEVRDYRPAPGDLNRWLENHKKFDPFRIPRIQKAMAHVLEYALLGLDYRQRMTLQTVSAFRMPVQYDMLVDLLVDELKVAKQTGFFQSVSNIIGGRRAKKLFSKQSELDSSLFSLEERGLLGWDKPANRYDLHPVVRGIVWNLLDENVKRDTYSSMYRYFESFPMNPDWKMIESLDELTPAIELYNSLIGLGRFDEACVVFLEHLENVTLYRLSACSQRIELLKMLFPDREDTPKLSTPEACARIQIALAQSYQYSGKHRFAIPLLIQARNLYEERHGEVAGVSISQINLSNILRLSGRIFDAEVAARRALDIELKRKDRFQQAVSLYQLGMVLAVRGALDSYEVLENALDILIKEKQMQAVAVVTAYLAQRAIWFDKNEDAQKYADRAWEYAQTWRDKRDLILVSRLQGQAALFIGDLTTAEERLRFSLVQSRMVNHVEEELNALVALAELRRKQNDIRTAKRFLSSVWKPAKAGPYRLILSDAFNLFARIAYDTKQFEESIHASQKAYDLAVCDGTPYVYKRGLIDAKMHLASLDIEEPELKMFDNSKHEPII